MFLLLISFFIYMNLYSAMDSGEKIKAINHRQGFCYIDSRSIKRVRDIKYEENASLKKNIIAYANSLAQFTSILYKRNMKF
jgi:hypothetical protein